MADSAIEWTDKTWNPVTGCTKVSPGCAHCYAEGVADRFWATQYPAIPTGEGLHADGERRREFTDVMTHADRLDRPLRWKKPARIFVNSMSDLFQENVPVEFIDQVFAVMALARQHTFQVLTKRAERMREYLAAPDVWERVELQLWERHTDDTTNAISRWPLSNVWLGVSVENQHFADERIPLLLQTPAAVRFVSYEPALGPVDFTPWVRVDTIGGVEMEPLLDWIIVGGESGSGARLFDVAWARAVLQQRSDTAVFVKQLGGNPWAQTAHHYGPGVDAHPYNVRYQLKSKKGGDINEWPDDLKVREFPSGASEL